MPYTAVDQRLARDIANRCYLSPQAWLSANTITALARDVLARAQLPTIICLCGSTRFVDAFNEVNRELTLDGKIVLSIGCHRQSDSELFAAMPPDQAAIVKAGLDDLHLHKIDLADEVLVLNVGGYIGESTRCEIAYALSMGKPVRYLEPIDAESQANPVLARLGQDDYQKKIRG